MVGAAEEAGGAAAAGADDEAAAGGAAAALVVESNDGGLYAAVAIDTASMKNKNANAKRVRNQNKLISNYECQVEWWVPYLRVGAKYGQDSLLCIT